MELFIKYAGNIILNCIILAVLVVLPVAIVIYVVYLLVRLLKAAIYKLEWENYQRELEHQQNDPDEPQ